MMCIITLGSSLYRVIPAEGDECPRYRIVVASSSVDFSWPGQQRWDKDSGNGPEGFDTSR